MIRLALTAILLYFVYGETGWATTLSLFLLFMGSEIQASTWYRKANNAKLLREQRWQNGLID